jgi:hypothetical protein
VHDDGTELTARMERFTATATRIASHNADPAKRFSMRLNKWVLGAWSLGCLGLHHFGQEIGLPMGCNALHAIGTNLHAIGMMHAIGTNLRPAHSTNCVQTDSIQFSSLLTAPEQVGPWSVQASTYFL